jgi:hypothetical protein
MGGWEDLEAASCQNGMPLQKTVAAKFLFGGSLSLGARAWRAVAPHVRCTVAPPLTSCPTRVAVARSTARRSSGPYGESAAGGRCLLHLVGFVGY